MTSRVLFDPVVRTQILSEAQIKQVHNATMKVLENTGVSIKTENARKILLDAGCKLKGKDFITIPSKLIEKTLQTAPSSVTLYDRLGQPRCELQGWKNSLIPREVRTL